MFIFLLAVVRHPKCYSDFQFHSCKVHKGGKGKSEKQIQRQEANAEKRNAEKADKAILRLVGKAFTVISPVQQKIDKLINSLGEEKLNQLPAIVLQTIKEKHELTTKWAKQCQHVMKSASGGQKSAWTDIEFHSDKEVSLEMKSCQTAIRSVNEAKKSLPGNEAKKGQAK